MDYFFVFLLSGVGFLCVWAMRKHDADVKTDTRVPGEYTELRDPEAHRLNIETRWE